MYSRKVFEHFSAYLNLFHIFYRSSRLLVRQYDNVSNADSKSALEKVLQWPKISDAEAKAIIRATFKERNSLIEKDLLPGECALLFSKFPPLRDSAFVSFSFYFR
jgi:hypothetical protein